METINEGYFYHIYNRGAGKADLFYSKRDYLEFIEKYFFYLFVSVETYAYCLLKNHFHFLIRVRTFEQQKELFQFIKANYPKGNFYGDQFDTPKPFHASKQFSHLMNSYTKSLNSRIDRSGTLVEGVFKRIKVSDENHLNHLVCYIHRNPIHHKLSNNYSAYPYSSFNQIISEGKTYLEKEKLLNQFGSEKNFIEAHQEFRMKLGDEYYLE
ncbi:MAG: hypothetical protein GVY07_05530 [Bacteroidetes bacterium]|jgi:REP element-mobilizing transposase RayT|nr:hypothetical protein [Bacteroidota bacterium]